MAEVINLAIMTSYNNQYSQGPVIDKDLFNVESAPLSPIASTDDDQTWINDLISQSAPMTTTNSFSGLSSLPSAYNDFDMSVYQTDINKYFDNQSVFSNNEFPSSSETSVTNSPALKAEKQDNTKIPDLATLNSKLEIIQKNNDLSSKSLESIFDTKDILKDETLSQPTMSRRKSSTSSNGSYANLYNETKKPKKRCARKRLTDTQKQAHNKIEKKYRININAKIAGLQQIIPWVAYEKTAFETGKKDIDSNDDNSCHRLNKSMILEKATDYILYLQQNEQKVLQENVALKREIVRLGGDVSKIQMQ